MGLYTLWHALYVSVALVDLSFQKASQLFTVKNSKQNPNKQSSFVVQGILGNISPKGMHRYTLKKSGQKL